MEVLGFIPARGGSKGIKNKNIKSLNGQPLLWHTATEAMKSRISRPLLSTDSNEIAELGRSLGLSVPFLRPNSLSGDKASIEDAIGYTLKTLKEVENYTPDVIVLLQPTSPLRRAFHINEALDLLKNETDTVVSVSEPMEHPADMVLCEPEGTFEYLLQENTKGMVQRQAFRPYKFINGAVYVFWVKTYEKYLGFPKKPKPSPLSSKNSLYPS